MTKLLLARQLAGKKIVMNDGEELGRLIDIEGNEKNGRMEMLIVEGNPDSTVARKMRKESGYIIIPYSSVLAASDYVIVDRKSLGV